MYNVTKAHRNVITLPLRSPHFEHVECGSKTVDARIFFTTYRRLQAGDVLKFVKDTENFILKKLTSMKKYENFRLLLQGEGVKSCLPDLQDGDIDSGVQLYHNFKANGESYAKLEMKYKVLALRLGDVNTSPRRRSVQTNNDHVTKLVIPPSVKSQFLTITLHTELPTEVTPSSPQATRITRHTPQQPPSTTPTSTTQPTPSPQTPPRIPPPTPETPLNPPDAPTAVHVVTSQPIQLSPPPVGETTPAPPDTLILKAAALVQSGKDTYRGVCCKLGINLDPTKKYIGTTGEDYQRLHSAVRKLRRHATKKRSREQVDLHFTMLILFHMNTLKTCR